MKALSVRQPWAWLLVHGHKDVENRAWPTKFRGSLLIHASKRVDLDGIEFVRSRFPEIHLPAYLDFERGGLVGKVEVVDCVETSASPWFFGPYGFVVCNARPLPFTDCRGKLRFFEVP